MLWLVVSVLGLSTPLSFASLAETRDMTTAAADAGIDRRIDVEILAGKECMAAWLYSSQTHSASEPGPAIVLAHGLGATKELKLDVFASKFNELGYTCLVFEYRCNGASTDLPRGLIDWKEQQKDWYTALAYVRAQENVDSERVGLFGTSFGGGHVIQVGAQDHRIKAVISQCPFTDGWASARCTGFWVLPRLFVLGCWTASLDRTNSLFVWHSWGLLGTVSQVLCAHLVYKHWTTLTLLQRHS